MKLQLIGKRERMRALLAVLVLLAAPPPPRADPEARIGTMGSGTKRSVKP
jgi:hypothetical protein